MEKFTQELLDYVTGIKDTGLKQNLTSEILEEDLDKQLDWDTAAPTTENLSVHDSNWYGQIQTKL